MTDPSRRRFNIRLANTALLASLFQHAARADALTGTLRWSVRPWLRDLQALASDVSAGRIEPRAWQRGVEETLAKVALQDFLRSIDFERLAREARFPGEGEGMQRLYFADEDGRFQALAFRPFLFTLKKGAAVVPHGHHNMATMHMVLQGRSRVRHFDRLHANDTHMVIRRGSDIEAGPGAVTTVSDDHHNIHWFDASSDRVFMFNIGVYQLGPGPFGDRDYIDPLAGVAMGDGLLRVPRLARAEAYAKYGSA